ncbi:MAG TPA: class B sortase [Bacilli bacterium]
MTEEGIRIIRNWTRILIMGLAAGVFVFSIVKITVYYAEGYRNEDQSNELRKIYYTPEKKQAAVGTHNYNILQAVKIPGASIALSLPDTSPKPIDKVWTVQERFVPLLERSQDVVGWLHIEGTAIDYPVVQAEDNKFYLEKDITQQKNAGGSIFMDFRNHIKKEDRHTILYGHNMKNKTMFADLLNYESEWYFDNHSLIQFDNLYENQKWQVFSAYVTNIYDDYIRTQFESKEDYRTFLDDIQNKSLHPLNTTVNEDDIILTLSTCSAASSEYRFAVHAKLIRED